MFLIIDRRRRAFFLPDVNEGLDEGSQSRNSQICQSSNSQGSDFGGSNVSRENMWARSMIQTGMVKR